MGTNGQKQKRSLEERFCLLVERPRLERRTNCNLLYFMNFTNSPHCKFVVKATSEYLDVGE